MLIQHAFQSPPLRRDQAYIETLNFTRALPTRNASGNILGRLSPLWGVRQGEKIFHRAHHICTDQLGEPHGLSLKDLGQDVRAFN